MSNRTKPRSPAARIRDYLDLLDDAPRVLAACATTEERREHEEAFAEAAARLDEARAELAQEAA